MAEEQAEVELGSPPDEGREEAARHHDDDNGGERSGGRISTDEDKPSPQGSEESNNASGEKQPAPPPAPAPALLSPAPGGAFPKKSLKGLMGKGGGFGAKAGGGGFGGFNMADAAKTVVKKLQAQKGPTMNRKASGSALEHGWHGEEAHKVGVFLEQKLGISLAEGPSEGHLPYIDLPIEVENGKEGEEGELVYLDVGDTIISIGGDSVIDADDPFEYTVELIEKHTERPLVIKFLAQSSPAPYIVNFPEPSAGIFYASKESSEEFPVVWKRDKEALLNDTSEATDIYPQIGDVMLAINGVELESRLDKEEEAKEIIQNTKARPIRILFQPHEDDSHKVVSFREERLGISLVTGASVGHLPVLSKSTQAHDGLKTFAPKVTLNAGDQLVAVAGESLIDSADAFAHAIELIQKHPQRPIFMRFMEASKPGPFSVIYRDVSMDVVVDEPPEGEHGGAAGYPMIIEDKDPSTPFPAEGDQILRVDGHTLRDPEDKMSEVAELISAGISEDESGRKVRLKPMRILFLPGDDPRHTLEFDEDNHDENAVDTISMDVLSQFAHSSLIAKLARQKQAEKDRPGEDTFVTWLSRLRSGILFKRVDEKDGKKRDVEILSTPGRDGIMYYPSSRGLPVVYKYADLLEVIPVEDAEVGSDQEMKDFFNGLDVEARYLCIVLKFKIQPSRLALVCPTEIAQAVAENGLRNAPKYWEDHVIEGAEDPLNPSKDKKQKGKKKKDKGGKKPKKPPGALDQLNNLYRPHHAANAAPARFKMGVIAEMQYPPRSHKDKSKPWSKADDENYDARLFRIKMQYKKDGELKEKPLKLPLPCFQPGFGMFMCAKITKFDKLTGTYTLRYEHGPYLPDETPDGTKNLSFNKHPDAVFIVDNVEPQLVTVDMSDNYGSHTPFFIFGITLIQVGVFSYYVFGKGSSPWEGGPEEWWMKVIGKFPDCGDLRSEWFRLFTYQFVHSGYNHIIFNALMQCLFGLPINMVHGNLRFFIMYELCVLGGSVNWCLVDGGQGALVGASGGVYGVFGINVAELIMNWESNSKGLVTRWGRLGMIAFVLGIDIFLYFTGGHNEHLSNAAHVGGFTVGMVIGILVVENLHLSDCEKYFILPMSYLTGGLIVLWGLFNYASHFPPEGQVWDAPYDTCCYQILDCGGFEGEKYDVFGCKRDYEDDDTQQHFHEYVTSDISGEQGWLETCTEMREYYDSVVVSE